MIYIFANVIFCTEHITY